MIAAAERLLLRVLEVPPPPSAPAGGHVQVFRPARNFYRYALFRWAGKQIGAVVGIVFAFRFFAQIPEFPGRWILYLFEYLGIGFLVLQIPVTLLAVRLDFQQRWYLVTDRSLRIRHGVFRVEERTMSFANIQNLSVRQGPIQRLLGISDVEVRTAGGGEGGQQGQGDAKKKSLHIGYFEGVDRAEEIKGLILGYLRRLRDAGLGDPEQAKAARPLRPAAAPASVAAPAPAAAAGALTLEAARGLFAEARRLRAAAGPGRPSPTA